MYKICTSCKNEKPLTDFYKNKTCKDGHGTECKDCVRSYNKAHYHKNRAASIASSRKWAIDNPDKRRHSNLVRQYGITLDDYMHMHDEQGGVCKICGNSETLVRHGSPKPLCVDHCHETGKVRGLLCHNCNTALGKFKDSPEILQSALNYLKRSL